MNKFSNGYNEFEKWYEEYFCNQQGEDSPYSYNDVKIAFLSAWKICKKELREKKTNGNYKSRNN